MTAARGVTERKDGDDLEAEIDARLGEIDLMLDYLQRRRADLLSAKSSSAESGERLRRLDHGGRSGIARQERLESLPWRAFEAGGAGQWTFVNDRAGKLLSELEPVRDVVEELGRGEPLVVGGYRYRLSQNGKFLNRTRVEQQRE
ncbi:MAG: hypothetical protein ABSF83_15805 [Nitrososphaerales archaeon]|jgi:hypothetical protein